MSTPYNPQLDGAGAPEPKRLERSMTDKFIAGVCGGIGNYLNVDATLIRIIAILFLLIGIVPGTIAYLVAWAIMPAEF